MTKYIIRKKKFLFKFCLNNDIYKCWFNIGNKKKCYYNDHLIIETFAI